ncbi:MAG: hypothetical protein MN733_04670 [Nitrososphaera sp.]|nr:hypothetical protein [Nitrososphaera sp.]
MKIVVFSLAVVLFLAFLSGCTTMSYRPTVDTQGKIDPQLLESDMKECAELAGMEWKDVLSTGILGGAAGSGMGAAGGTIMGGSLAIAPMAAGGAAMIGIPAVAYGLVKGVGDARMAFRMCLRGRGYSVVK